MKNKRLEELEVQVEHLQERIDNLRDFYYEGPASSEYYWNKFEDLLAWAKRFDANSDEYKKLAEVAWSMLDKYLDILKVSFGGGK